GRIAARFPEVAVAPVEADFTRPLALPDGVAGLPRLGFFPGSTIGNMLAARAVDLLRGFRQSLGEGALFLIGVDRIKPLDVLVAAYDDAAGVTAAFNRNLLHRINRDLGGTVPVDAFTHRAIWNDQRARIEMHLEAARDIDFTVDGRPFAMTAGETIHTENSHKYGLRDARLLLRAGGWTPIVEWSDPQDWFTLILAEAGQERFAP
ncbi:L-histidine N(alpha)-methyltransferase, partial [Sphingomonas sp.]|uniref:L-histidine N(alpha)-methyltransferase n=1 Tax=Sphingomonas sp. TaxID=28214 RepID=UPI002BA6019A